MVKLYFLALVFITIQIAQAKMRYIPSYKYDLNALYTTAKTCHKDGQKEVRAILKSLSIYKDILPFKVISIRSLDNSLHPIDVTDCKAISKFPTSQLTSIIEYEIVKENVWDKNLSEESLELIKGDNSFESQFVSGIYPAWIDYKMGHKEAAYKKLKSIFSEEESRSLNLKRISLFSNSKTSFIKTRIDRLELIEKVIGKEYPKENYQDRVKKVKIYLSNLPTSIKVT